MVWERIEVDPVGRLPDIAEPIRELPCQNLLQHFFRLVEIISGGDCLGNLLSIGLVVGVLSRINNGLQDRLEAVGIGGGKVLGTRESAARMSVPNVFGKHVD